MANIYTKDTFQTNTYNRDSSSDESYTYGESTDEKAPSQKAVKTYVDNVIGDIETVLHTMNSGGAATNTFTFILTGNGLSSLYELSVNNITYSYNDFTNNILTLNFPQGTSIIWAATASGLTSVEPSSGSLMLNSDSTITINITTSGGSIH